MTNLENRVAVVTGASAGIGRATARLLAQHGARLVLNARREDRLGEIVAETGGTAVAGDITDAGVRKRLMEACGGRIDLLVNNAGYGEPGPVELVPEERFRRQFEVNLFAAAAMIQAAAPLMRARRFGRIINISSVAGRFGYPLFGWYCASKHALEGLSDAARLELAPWGIKVVLIEPGPVKTEFFGVAKGLAQSQMKDRSSPYKGFFEHTDTIERNFERQATTAVGVARVVVKACLKRNPRGRYAVTAMAKVLMLALRVLPRPWLDAVIRREFRVPRRADVG